MNISNTCPFCNQALKPGELLIAKYYEPKNWFVLLHLVPCETETFNLSSPNDSLQVASIPGYKSYCGQANWQITDRN